MCGGQDALDKQTIFLKVLTRTMLKQGPFPNVLRNSVNSSSVHPVNIPPLAAMRSDTFSIKSRSKLVNLKSNLRSNVEIFSVQTPAELV